MSQGVLCLTQVVLVLSKWWDNASLVLTITYISLFPGFPVIGRSLHPASNNAKYCGGEEGKDRHLLPRELWHWISECIQGSCY